MKQSSVDHQDTEFAPELSDEQTIDLMTKASKVNAMPCPGLAQQSGARRNEGRQCESSAYLAGQ